MVNGEEKKVEPEPGVKTPVVGEPAEKEKPEEKVPEKVPEAETAVSAAAEFEKRTTGIAGIEETGSFSAAGIYDEDKKEWVPLTKRLLKKILKG